MKHALLIILAFAGILLSSSCSNETSSIMSNLEELEGIWFRSYPNKVWGGHNQPSFERGETHVRLTFQDNGEFIYNRTVLGLYENTLIEDTTAIVIESGTYSLDEETIEIVLNKRIWWDSFYADMVGFEESGVNSKRFMDVTFEIISDELNLVYFTATDEIYDEQETPGIDKFEEVYIKE